MIYGSIEAKSYFSGKCRLCSSKDNGENSLFKNKETNPNYSGGMTIRRGYKLIRLNKDDNYFDMADKHGYDFEHRLVYAKSLGRSLMPYEIIHHINNNKSDNRLENLMIVSGLQNTAYYLFDKYTGIIWTKKQRRYLV